jgi:peptide/nickel transport system substrate-binding protein
MMRLVTRSRQAVLALVVVFTVVAAACGSDSKKSTGGSGSSSSTAATIPSGEGTLVIGAEQEPDCADWISSCAGASWGTWSMQEHTMPRVWDLAKVGGTWQYVPSPLLASPPVLEPGPPQKVTYKINPAAVWSDGKPITSTDFKYTWDQIVNTKDVYDPSGWETIESVDDSDPSTAVVTFNTPYGAWKRLFAFLYGVFPSHILQGKNRNNAMADGYSWSGGPWKIESWDRGVNVTLVPNDKYWGEKPKINKVIFQFIPDTSAEFKAFQTAEVSAVYPQPQPDAIEQIQGGLPNAYAVYTADTANLEALWMNMAAKPLGSQAVRQAIAYAIDRNALVDRLFGPLGVREPMQTLNPPIQAAYADTTAWSNYTKNFATVDQLLTGDGWAKGSDGIYAKRGKKLSLTVRTTTGNQRRELTEQILQEQLRAAGIELKIANQKSDQLFGETLPGGDYQLMIYAQVATDLEPGLCPILCTDSIPTKANDNSGNNLTRSSVPAADPLMAQVDTNTDDAVRASSQKQADALLAGAQVSLPLDPLPNIAIWNNRIRGSIVDNPLLAMFWNMNTWTLTG